MTEIGLPRIVRTMIWTLRPRAEEHACANSLFDDAKAREWFAQVARDDDMEPWYSPAFQVAIAVRTRVIDNAASRFAASHDAPLVVELGAGLTTRPYRLDLPQASWVVLDLPEAVAVRRRFEPEAENLQAIASSVLDYGWMDRLPQAVPENILFIAEGLFMFLPPQDCRELVGHLRTRFAGSTLLLDMPGQPASEGEARTAETMGVPLQWIIHDEHDVAALGLRLVQVWPFLQQYPERLKPVLGDDLTMPGARNASLVIEALIYPTVEPPSIGRIDIHEQQDAAMPPENHPGAIHFRDRCLAARKAFLHGQQRMCPPEQTLERIRPYYEMAGITRVADITGLDRVGIPVMLVTRPNAPTLSNSTGKGCSLAAATVSGVMESIEIYLAETVSLQELYLPYKQLAKEKPVIPVAYLPLVKHSVFSVLWPERWTMGWDLVTQQEVAVPAQMVMLHSVREVLGPFTNFQMGSNGLASGNHFLEALASALYELIERDAVTTRQYLWRTLHIPPPRLRLGSIQSPLARELLARCQAARIEVILFDTTNDIGIPTYQAVIYDKTARGAGLAGGQGTHLDPEVALVRALTEAAQSRVVGIAGSRDEYFRRHSMLFKLSDSSGQIRALESIPETVEGERQATINTTFQEDIRVILERLDRVGLHQVIVFEVSRPDMPICALRVIVPGLEGYMFDYYTPGPRAQAVLQQHVAWLKSKSQVTGMKR